MQPPSNTSYLLPLNAGSRVVRSLIDPHVGLVGRGGNLDGRGDVAGRPDRDLDRMDARAIVVEPEDGFVVARLDAGERPTDRQVGDARQYASPSAPIVPPGRGCCCPGASTPVLLRCSSLQTGGSDREGGERSRGRRLMRTPSSSDTTRPRNTRAPIRTVAVSPRRRRLHRWIRTGGRVGASARNCSASSRPSSFSIVRSWVGLATPARRSERFGDLLGREELEGTLVHRVGIRAESQHHHHVREVDGLSPRRGPDLDEEDIDHLQSLIPHHQVGRLDVAVGEPVVPHVADEPESLIDDGRLDVGFADLDRSVEELHHDHVLALGGDLHDPVRLRDREVEVFHQSQGVVLVLDEPPHGAERASRPPGLRTGSCDRSCTNGRPARGSSRRASRTGSVRGRPRRPSDPRRSWDRHGRGAATEWNRRILPGPPARSPAPGSRAGRAPRWRSLRPCGR